MIYFDNGSTTRVSDVVADKMYALLKTQFGNPSSLHSLGFQAEKELIASRKIIAAALGVGAEEIYFTSGGTEANNTAVIGTAMAYRSRGTHLITMSIEHPSVTDSFKYLESKGFQVTYLPVDEKGYVNIQQLKNAITDKTTLVSIMYVNNEVGTVQNIEEIARVIKETKKDCYFHVDCVQAFCKHKIPIKNVDLISVSSHKIHGPKGVGALYVRNGVRCESLHFGGGQEKGFRPGTENIAGIVGFACAVEYSGNLLEKAERVQKVKNTLLEGAMSLENVFVNGDEEKGSPYILNLSFQGVRGEVLLHALEDKEIYVATGSACSSKLKKKQKIVDFLVSGRGENAVRFSFCEENTTEQAEKVVQALKELVPILRKFQPR